MDRVRRLLCSGYKRPQCAAPAQPGRSGGNGPGSTRALGGAQTPRCPEKSKRSQERAPAESSPPPTCSGTGTSAGFPPLPTILLFKERVGLRQLCRGAWLSRLLPKPEYPLWICISPQVSRKRRGASQSGFSCPRARAGARAQPLRPRFLRADLEASNRCSSAAPKRWLKM